MQNENFSLTAPVQDQRTEHLADNILRGFNSREKAFEVKDYPYGRLRTSIFFWIESKPKHGDRFCSYTINPKTGRHNATKAGTYSPFLYMYMDEKEHVTYGSINAYKITEFEARFAFIINKIGEAYVNDIQKANLRIDYIQHLAGNFPYCKPKYTAENYAKAITWIKAKIEYIKKCPFAELVDFSEDQPAFDFPGEEVKMIIREL